MSVDAGAAGASLPARPARGGARIVRLALGELSRGIGSFVILIACIALGVAVIAGIGSLSDGLRAGFERQGTVLLGGDATLARPHRRATEAEKAWLDRLGRVSETATLRSMGRRLDASDQTLVEVKGIDGAYPLVGELRLVGGGEARKVLGDGPGAIVDPILLERLGLKPGDWMSLGRSKVQIRGLLALAGEPDKIADRFTVGPRVFVTLETLDSSGLAAPGSLVRWRYAVDLPGVPDRTALAAFRDRVKAELPDAGYGVRDRTNPSPALSRTLDRLRQFLTLIGLAALMIGGVGVANAVAAYVDRRRKAIATMKSLGASSRQIFALHLIQVMALATFGIAIGLFLGFLIPLIAGQFIQGLLPVELQLAAEPATLALAVAYGLLVALLFSLWPLGRAGMIRAATLFRDELGAGHQRPPWPIVLATVLSGAALVLLAVMTSEAKALALYFCAGVAVVFIVFPALGSLIARIARALPRPRNPAVALALGEIGSEGGLTRSIVLSLGAGLSLLTTVALVDASIVREIESRLPVNSPDYFLIDIPNQEMPALRKLVEASAPGVDIVEAPMLRGRIVSLKGRPVDQIKAPPEAQWVLRGDRGLTYAGAIPNGSRVVEGRWWDQDHQGEPLVSFDAEIARHLGLALGDSVTVNVFGRNVTATIANLREVEWESLGINFVLVFSPNVLKGAPHNMLATVALPKGFSLTDEARVSREIGKAHPAVTVIRVKDAIAAFNAVFSKIMIAVRLAGAVTLVAGALVLAGALVTAQRRRIQLAVILKTLGGTRRQILAIHLAEYLLLAIATAGLALAVGTLGAWATTSLLMRLEFSFSLAAVAQALLLAVGLVLAFGLAATRRVLSARPVPYLRSG